VDNTVTCTYDAAGSRDTATYVAKVKTDFTTYHSTNTTTTKWKYENYLSLGDPASSSRVFQTLVQMSGSNRTPEEFHYQYDSSGRITNATFAMTPESGYTPSSGATY
jgi:hypothetical protein